MARPRKQKPSGLGDVIENITEATGIKAAVKFIMGEDCGCDKRKEYLNQKFRFGKVPNCLTEQEYNELTTLLKLGFFTDENQLKFNAIFERVMQEPAPMTNCASCMIDRVKRIKIVYNSYNQ